MAENGSVNAIKPTLLLLVCRVRLYSDAIADMLAGEASIDLVGIVGGGDDVIAELTSAAPDVVLLDTGTPGALALAARLMRERPLTRILGFGVNDVPEEVVACAEAGLSGYVPCTASIADLVSAVRRIARGDTVCSVAMADGLFRHLRGAALGILPSAAERVLTQRQKQILRLIDEGLSNKQIAQRLSLGTSTVKNHVHEILDRLHVARRAEAAAHIRRMPPS
jgi:two-component system nitrate/nitrite response regulator NarL